MAQRTKIEKDIELLKYRQRRGEENRTLISADNTLDRITFDVQGRIVYGSDGLITLSAAKN